MRTKWFGAAILTGLLALPVAGIGQTRRDEKSDQVLRDAIQQLEQIKNRVHGVAHVYGGHRGQADHYIDLTVDQLQQALKYEERHEK